MSYGGIEFEHVWAYQIKCMMANQYDRLIEAIANNKPDDIIAVCLRLGWNDAFKHVSENIDDTNMLASCKTNNWIGTVFSKRQNKLASIKKLNDEDLKSNDFRRFANEVLCNCGTITMKKS